MHQPSTIESFFDELSRSRRRVENVPAVKFRLDLFLQGQDLWGIHFVAFRFIVLLLYALECLLEPTLDILDLPNLNHCAAIKPLPIFTFNVNPIP